jgi:hypothetical protein
LDWLLREAWCLAKPGAEREVLERLVQQEVARMHGQRQSADTIADFQAAAAVHISHFYTEQVDQRGV